MYDTDKIINQLSTNNDILELFNKFNIKNIFAFGSLITDNFTDYSDIDLAIISDKKLSLDCIIDMELYLENFFNREIDIIDLNNPDLDFFVKINILNNNKLIYSTDDCKLFNSIYTETEKTYNENKDFIYFRRMDVLS
ncbi:nucleotidyltransferase family protein [Clostridium ihumii]|uniref:nucleotidyltransferase family protein n=1 Tax=Clostridium ihumii TaxID=1470356 RepID=UPI003D32E7E9